MYFTKRRFRTYLRCELLENRTQPSTLLFAAEGDDTLTQAQLLSDLTPYSPVAVQGHIGSATTRADVDWFAFNLPVASTVTFTLGGPGGQPFAGILSLYNTDFASGDPAISSLGHRLIDQQQCPSAATQLTFHDRLAPGDYYMAISGAGNRW